MVDSTIKKDGWEALESYGSPRTDSGGLILAMLFKHVHKITKQEVGQLIHAFANNNWQVNLSDF